MVVREPGIGGTCAVCGELFGSDARFCWACGTPVAPGAIRPPAVSRAIAEDVPLGLGEATPEEAPATVEPYIDSSSEDLPPPPTTAPVAAAPPFGEVPPPPPAPPSEQPTTAMPAATEPAPAEPAVDEPAAEAPVAEEPVVEEPAAEEPAPAQDAPVADPTVAEERAPRKGLGRLRRKKAATGEPVATEERAAPEDVLGADAPTMAFDAIDGADPTPSDDGLQAPPPPPPPPPPAETSSRIRE
jgi:hypothetical protein